MIILLNGTSSSGKTTTAKALLNQLPEPYFYFSVDQFLESSMPLTINMDRPADLALIDRAISGFCNLADKPSEGAVSELCGSSIKALQRGARRFRNFVNYRLKTLNACFY